jgi:hypothetical protein
MKQCKVCNETKELTDFRTGRNDCKSCENKKRVERKLKQKVEDPTYYDKQRGYDKKRKKIMRENMTPEEMMYESNRSLVKNSINGYSEGSKTFKLLGIDYESFRKHIESQFEEGMTWENRELFGWHLEHIIPRCTANTLEEDIKLHHYTNLRPMWSGDNWKKGTKIL